MEDRLGQGKHGTEIYTVEGCTSQRRGAGPRKFSITCPWQFCFICHNLGSGERHCARCVLCLPSYPGVDEPQFGKLRCKGIKKMDWRSQGIQHDLEGLECQLGIWGFCWAVGTSGPNHVGMDEAGPAEGQSSQLTAWGLFVPGPVLGTG